MHIMGQKGSKKAKEAEEVKQESSSDEEVEEEEEGDRSTVANAPVQKTKNSEEQNGEEEKWWNQPVPKENKRSRWTRQNKRPSKVRERSRRSSKEGRGEDWDKEEVIDVEDNHPVIGIREEQRWAWTENGQGRREENDDAQPEDVDLGGIEHGDQTNSKEYESIQQDNVEQDGRTI